jgi:hypothetical protein
MINQKEEINKILKNKNNHKNHKETEIKEKECRSNNLVDVEYHQ